MHACWLCEFVSDRVRTNRLAVVVTKRPIWKNDAVKLQQGFQYAESLGKNWTQLASHRLLLRQDRDGWQSFTGQLSSRRSASASAAVSGPAGAAADSSSVSSSGTGTSAGVVESAGAAGGSTQTFRFTITTLGIVPLGGKSDASV